MLEKITQKNLRDGQNKLLKMWGVMPHKKELKSIKKISIETMTEIFDREVIVDEDYKPSDFDYK